MNFSTFGIESNEYPPLLREIGSAPMLLHVRGALPDPTLPAVAVVGTRKATRDGKELARKTAHELADAGVIVVSGLAMGIDTEAHKGALEAGGITIAVLSHGGAIISEYGSDEPSYKGRFIERNRIISGLCLGVIVIEAPEKSGAISTARFAAEQGRGVGGFFSCPHNKKYKGSHELIRDGATLVTNVGEVLEDLGLKKSHKLEDQMKELSGDEYKIVSVLKDAGTPIDIDTIIELTTLEPQAASNIIMTLVVEGIIKEGSTGYEISNS